MDMTERASLRPHEFDHEWLRAHLSEERERTALLGEIREAIFGSQDGLVSTLALVTAVGAATMQQFPVLVAGFAAALAGMFSMAIGEYLGSKSQREIYDNLIGEEREEVRERPNEAEAEVAFMLEQEGLDREIALRAARDLAADPEVLLRIMVEKEHGIVVEVERGPFAGALVMGVSYGLAALVPVLPYVFLPIETALWAAVAFTGAVLFGIGAGKTRWTKKNALRSGLEIVLLATGAAIAGYVFGTILPGLLGVEINA